MAVKIINRSEWEARPPKKEGLPFVLPVPKIIVTHTMTTPCNSEDKCKHMVRQIQRRHMDKHLDILYNFLIGGDGQIYEGTGFCTNNFFPKPEPKVDDKTSNINDAPEITPTTEEEESTRKSKEEKETMLWDAIRKYRDTFPPIPKLQRPEDDDMSWAPGMHPDLIKNYKRRKEELDNAAEREEEIEKEEANLETIRKNVPKTIGELLQFVATYTEEATGHPMRPPPWDGSDPRYHGDTITIAFIGDHTDVIKELQVRTTRKAVNGDQPPQNIAVSKLESVALDLISHGVENDYIDENRKVKWYRQSKWKDYIQKSLSWVSPKSNEDKEKKTRTKEVKNSIRK